MSQSPTSTAQSSQEAYLEAFNQLALKIRSGQSFSGRERNCLFLNTGGAHFADASAVAAVDFPDDARGSALADWDGDGDLDLWVSNRTAPRLRFLRNDSANKPWLTVSLTGNPARRCPRDAVGARVEVWRRGAEKLTRFLAAGDGFLSQGSKRLHFGLGAASEIEKVVVFWPGGSPETFTGLEPNTHWHLTQGGEPRKLSAAVPVPQSAAAPSLPAPSDSLRLCLSQPLLLPALTYTDMSGNAQTLSSLTEKGPVLLNLWAGWCAPCAAELQDFAHLPEALPVLALNVERLDPASTVTSEQALDFLKKAGHKDLSGWADEALVAMLDRLLREAVYRHHRMPVPASFLIDKGGWLTVIYKGAVPAATITADLALLDAGPEAALAAAIPFPGVWASRTAFVPHVVAVAAAWREMGMPNEARALLEKFVKDHPPVSSDERAARQFSEAQFWLGDLELAEGNGSAALEHFSTARQAMPGNLPAQLGEARALALLGKAEELNNTVRSLLATPAGPDALETHAEYYVSQSNWGQAITCLREAISKNPRFVPGLNSLAWLLATVPEDALRDGAESLRLVDFFMQAPAAKENPEFQLTYSAALAETGDFPGAIAACESCLDLARARADRTLARRALEALEKYRAGQPWRLSGKLAPPAER